MRKNAMSLRYTVFARSLRRQSWNQLRLPLAFAFAAHGLAAVAATAALETHQPVARCEELVDRQIAPALLGLPNGGVRVATALVVPEAAPGDRAYCAVEGSVLAVAADAQPIRFRVNLPMQWNGKALHVGGGGYNGQVVDGLILAHAAPGDARPVAAGYVTFGSDSGHGSAGFVDPAPGRFGLNDEELANFGGDQLRKVRDAAVQLVLQYYGKAPRRTYFYGSSQGGHEALTVAQRWPELYDGVVAIHPAYNFTALQLSGLSLGKALYRTPGSWLSPAKIAAISTAALQRCDGLDGLADGLIGNVRACRGAFDIASLRCEAGRDAGPTCLSDEQIATVRVFDSRTRLGVRLRDGASSFARWPLLTGAFGPGSMPFFGLGMRPTPAAVPTMQDAFVYFMGDQLVRYMVLRDPMADTQRFEPRRNAPSLRRVSALIDANSSDLDGFRRRGGKLLLLHGTVDMAIPPENSVDYFRRLVARYGRTNLRRFVRFYMVPGFGHGDGAFQMRWGALAVLDRWADQGVPPQDLKAVDMAPATTGRTRPLCEYPGWPRYAGHGSPDLASSFRCVER